MRKSNKYEKHNRRNRTRVRKPTKRTKTKTTRELLYVTLSRVTKLSNLFIVGQFNPPPAPGSDDSTVAEINRLKTQKQLKLNFNTLQSKFGPVVAYHNITSFFKY